MQQHRMNADYDSYRPKSSHGRSNTQHRNVNRGNQSRQSTESTNAPVRPKSSRGRSRMKDDVGINARAYAVQNTVTQSRPKSRGMYAGESQVVSPEYTHQTYGANKHNPYVQSKLTRETPINSDHNTYYQPLKSDDNTYQDSNDSEFDRPKSSRGRRMPDAEINAAYGEGCEHSPTRRARPKSAKGRARMTSQPQAAYHPEHQDDQADVLVIDRPCSPVQANYEYTHQINSPVPTNTAYAGQYDIPVQSPCGYTVQPNFTQQIPGEYGGYQVQSSEEIQTIDSPRSEVDINIPRRGGVFGNTECDIENAMSTYESGLQGAAAFRPMSGRSSARPPTASERKQLTEGALKDNDFLRVATATPLSARPDSASSFSRYNILPSIGLKPVAARQTPPTRIPAAYREPIQREDSVPKQESLSTSPTFASAYSETMEPFHTVDRFVSESIDSLSVNDSGPVTSNINTSGSHVHGANVGDMSRPLNEKPIEISTGETSSQILSTAEVTTVPNTDSAVNNVFSETTQYNTSAKSETNNNETAENANVPTFPPLTREIRLPAEPKTDENSVLLAIKLPDGKRVQRYFLQSHTLKIVLNFAEVSSQLDFTGTEIVCDAPRKVFSDLSVKLCDTGLQNRTVIHIQTPDT